ncbi:MAG: alpha/beta hydrolase [Promethearchaeota archaeon]
MKSSNFNFTDRDGIEIFVYKWEPDITPKGIIQISHGMAEHAKRYTRLAEFLCNNGYICYANDHQGHGRTAGDLTESTLKGNAGVLGPGGWNGVVNDLYELSKIIKEKNPNLPLFLLGHSWGSWLAQDYIQRWGKEIKGMILSGTIGKARKLIIQGGQMIAKSELEKLGPTEPSLKMDEASFKSYNTEWSKEEGATGFEWLSRDKAEVQKYIEDPWCGFMFPAPFWLELLSAFERLWKKENEQKIPKDLAIFFIAGSLDPVGRKTKDVIAIINRYKEYGIKDVDYKFYKDARHEVFNEINRNEVFKDVLNWLDSHL